MAFNNIKIARFRGIHKCEINDLKQVNLFVGKNNCGKTSVLDAIFLLTSLSKIGDVAMAINLFRDYSEQNIEASLSDLFYCFDAEKKIRISGEGKGAYNRKLSVLPKIGNSNEIEIDSILSSKYLDNKQTERLVGLNSSFTVEGTNFKTSLNKIEIIGGVASRTVTEPKGYKEKFTCKYITTRHSVSLNLDSLANIIENKKEANIIKLLQQIEPRLIGINLIQNRIMVDLGDPKLLALEVLGDGLRRLLAITLSIYECKDGVLLIDEIDNGLHYSSMNTLWKMILATAKEYNVQLFATSHNIDSLRSLKQVLEKEFFIEQQESTVCYNLNRVKDDILKSYQYDFEQFKYAIDMENEIR